MADYGLSLGPLVVQAVLGIAGAKSEMDPIQVRINIIMPTIAGIVSTCRRLQGYIPESTKRDAELQIVEAMKTIKSISDATTSRNLWRYTKWHFWDKAQTKELGITLVMHLIALQAIYTILQSIEQNVAILSNLRDREYIADPVVEKHGGGKGKPLTGLSSNDGEAILTGKEARTRISGSRS